MTISSELRRAGPFPGNGVTTLFPFTFKVFKNTDVKVLKVDTNGNSATLMLDSDYSVSLNADQNSTPGGVITYPISGAPLVAGYSIVMLGDLAYLQPTDLTNGGGFYPRVIEDMGDRSTIQIQQLAEIVSRSLTVTEAEANLPALPVASARAGGILGFDAAGNPEIFPPSATIGAGDLRNELWKNGTDFTAGTSTTVTTSRVYGSKANLGTLVMSGIAQAPDTYQLNGTFITFLDDNGNPTPIPLGVTKIYAIGGTTLSIYTPADGSISDVKLTPGSKIYNRATFTIDPRDFGAIGNGVADDTAPWAAALAVVSALGGGRVTPSPGNYLISHTLAVTADNVVIDGGDRYAVTISVPANATGFTGYASNAVFILNGNNNGLRNIGIDGNIANNAAQAFGAVAQTVAKSGLFVEDCYIRGVIYNGVILNPATGTCSNFSIHRNRIENIGWGAITAYCSTNGDITGNSIVSCGANGIVTGYNSGTGNFNVAQFVRINDNFVTKAAPPTHIVGGAAETGFLIVYGAGDQYIAVESNLCWDNRNSGDDGIGLGQDGTRYNQGCTVMGNIVGYAGLFGIDATTQSSVQNNIILYSTQCGIKVGTDLGGNCTNCLIDGNLIIQPNNPTAKYPTVQNMGIQVSSNPPYGIYSGIKIRNNTVLDSRSGGAQLTQYGLEITFQFGLTMQDNEFSGNDFSQVATLGVFAGGTGPANSSGWRWKNNVYPQNVVPATGSTPVVFGCENVTLNQASATTVTNLIGGYEGMTLDIQLNDGNTTWKFNSNAVMYGNGNTNLSTSAGNWMQFKFFNGVWAGYQTVH